MKHEKHGFPCTDDSCWCKNFQKKNAMYKWEQMPGIKQEQGLPKECKDGLSDEWWEGPGPHMDIRDDWDVPTINTEDVVNHPSHYEMEGFEVLDVIREVLTHEEYIGYLRGNILKYHLRANKKGGNEDIQKANYYSNELNYELNNNE